MRSTIVVFCPPFLPTFRNCLSSCHQPLAVNSDNPNAAVKFPQTNDFAILLEFQRKWKTADNNVLYSAEWVTAGFRSDAKAKNSGRLVRLTTDV